MTRRDVGASTSTHIVQSVDIIAPSSTTDGLHNHENSLSHSVVPIPYNVSVVPLLTTSRTIRSALFLHNVTDEVPQGRLPQFGRPVLEMVSEVSHDDVHSHGVEQTQQDTLTVQGLEIFVAAAPLPHTIENVDMHESPKLIYQLMLWFRVLLNSMAHNHICTEQIQQGRLTVPMLILALFQKLMPMSSPYNFF